MEVKSLKANKPRPRRTGDWWSPPLSLSLSLSLPSAFVCFFFERRERVPHPHHHPPRVRFTTCLKRRTQKERIRSIFFLPPLSLSRSLSFRPPTQAPLSLSLSLSLPRSLCSSFLFLFAAPSLSRNRRRTFTSSVVSTTRGR